MYEAREWKTAAALGKPLVRSMVKIHGGRSKESEQILLLRDIAVLQTHEVRAATNAAADKLKRDRSSEPRPPKCATPITSILKKESSFLGSMVDTADSIPARPRCAIKDAVTMGKSMPTVGSLFVH